MTERGFRKVAERLIHRGHVIELVEGTFEAPDGSTFTRDLLHHPGAVAVVPLHEDGTVTVVRQFRAPLGADLLEIPAGLRDVPDEAMETTAARELAEEVGLAAGSLQYLVGFHNAAGHSDEMVHVFVARDLRPVERATHGPEEAAMQVERHPLDALRAMIASGEVTDAKTIVGLALLGTP